MKDNEDYIITGNAVTFSNGYSVRFEYPIKETVLVDKTIIIFVEAPFDVIYNQNVFAVSTIGDFLWRVGKVPLFYWGTDNCPYIGLIYNQKNELVLFNWCDTAVVVDLQTGDVIRKYPTK